MPPLDDILAAAVLGVCLGLLQIFVLEPCFQYLKRKRKGPN